MSGMGWKYLFTMNICKNKATNWPIMGENCNKRQEPGSDCGSVYAIGQWLATVSGGWLCLANWGMTVSLTSWGMTRHTAGRWWETLHCHYIAVCKSWFEFEFGKCANTFLWGEADWLETRIDPHWLTNLMTSVAKKKRDLGKPPWKSWSVYFGIALFLRGWV